MAQDSLKYWLIKWKRKTAFLNAKIKFGPSMCMYRFKHVRKSNNQ